MKACRVATCNISSMVLVLRLAAVPRTINRLTDLQAASGKLVRIEFCVGKWLVGQVKYACTHL